MANKDKISILKELLKHFEDCCVCDSYYKDRLLEDPNCAACDAYGEIEAFLKIEENKEED